MGPGLITPSNKMLVQAVLDGEKAAYHKLYDRYAPLVRAICFDTTRNLANAQDLAQEVFIRAYKNLGQLRDPERFGKWIISIARLSCRQWYRKTARERVRFTEFGQNQSKNVNPSEDDRIEQLRKAITTLPQKERLALHVFYLQGNSADTTRAILGLSRSGFYRLLERIRKKLGHLLTREQENAL
ncbi:MAG: RNA polymerase sigma factor [Planctomycetota bacterium]|jgi:RNA polymerase sigma-70 factor (ECF subfamily)